MTINFGQMDRLGDSATVHETFIENAMAHPSMDGDETALAILSREKTDYALALDGKSHPMVDVTVSETDTPVREPTRRGNIYVEKAKSHRIAASVDADLAATLSRTMLGPSAEFGGLLISAESGSAKTEIVGSLLSMARTGGMARLQISIVEVRSQS